MDGLFCVPCSIFLPKATGFAAFVREPYNDWSNVDRVAERHTKCESHMQSVEAAKAFLRIFTGTQVNAMQQLSKAYRDKIARNIAALESIVKIIILCGHQNLALRGDTEETSNFIQLINFRSETDEQLKKHLELAPRNAKYISHRIQNELIHLCGQQIQGQILMECRQADYFSILLDETTDVSVTEQVTFVLLYIDRSGVRQEQFVTFADTHNTTGETLYLLICEKLKEWNLDKNKVVGLGFDGASNMSGKIKGVQGRFSKDVPGAQYVHCRAHSLNLAIVYACKEPSVRNMYGVVSETVNFIGASAKRLQVYTSTNENADRLKKFCTTRWSSHEESLRTFKTNITYVVETLHFISLNVSH